MNIIEHWAKLVNESFNPDDDKNDKIDMEGDKWEQIQKDIAEINKKLSIKEADDDSEDDDGEPFDDDPEFKKTMDKSDEYLDKLDKAKERNAKRADGEMSQSDVKADVEDEQKKWFIFARAEVYRPGASKEEIDNMHSRDDMAKMKEGKYDVNFFKIVQCDTEDQAKKRVAAIIDACDKKYGIKREDFKSEVTYGEGKTAKVVPQSILDVDPNAVGFMYTNVEGQGKQTTRGDDSTATYDKIDKVAFAEFIIYRASNKIPVDGNGFFELGDAIDSEFDPEFKANKKAEQERREAYEKAVKGLATMQKELAAERAKLKKEKGLKANAKDSEIESDAYAASASDTKLMTDKEIIDAFNSEGKSIDGYATRSDEDPEDAEDDKERIGKFGDASKAGYSSNQYDRDEDDYEGNQNIYEEGSEENKTDEKSKTDDSTEENAENSEEEDKKEEENA